MHPPALFISKESIASSSSKKFLKLSFAPIFKNPQPKLKIGKIFSTHAKIFPASLDSSNKYIAKRADGKILPNTKLEISVKTWAVEWLLNRKLSMYAKVAWEIPPRMIRTQIAP